MRAGFVIVGVVVLIVGLIILLVPLIPVSVAFTAPPSSQCPSSGCTAAYNVYAASPSVTGSVATRFSWSSATPVTFVAFTCSNPVATYQLSGLAGPRGPGVCGQSVTVANSTGTGGAYSFPIPPGGSVVYYAISSPSQPATVTGQITTTSPVLGIALVAVGVVVLILGLALKSRGQKRSALARY
ncbi:MAG: hypothetical protein ACREBZ_04430 [Thermoplasmata archaeon]